MLKYIIKQWKNKKTIVFLILFGFFIANSILSVGVSISVENYKQINDQTSGNPNKQICIDFIKKEKEKNQEVLDIVEGLVKYGEIQIISPVNGKLDEFNQEVQLVPVMFERESDWHIPIIVGRYFQIEDNEYTTKKIVIGTNIANKLAIEINDQVKIDGKSYQVIGICGRKIRETIWDDVIYINGKEYMEQNCQKIYGGGYVSCLLKEGKMEVLEDSKNIIIRAEQQNIKVSLEELPEGMGFSSFKNSIILTIGSASTVFLVAFINITNLMVYWIMERKQTLGIMKALGASNQYIASYMIAESVVITIVSSILAIIIQYIVLCHFHEFLEGNQIYIEVTAFNLIISTVFSVIFGLLAAIIPVKNIIKIRPAEIISQE